MGLTDGANEQIQSPFMASETLLCVRSRRDILGGSQLCRIFLLVVTPGDGRDLGTHLARKHRRKVSQTADTDDPDPLGSRSRTVLHERGEDGDAAAEHGRDRGGVEGGGNGDGESGGASPVLGEPSLGGGSGFTGFAPEEGRIEVGL